MGKGDHKTRRGKIFRGSFGNTRRRKKRASGVEVAVKQEAAPAAKEAKKETKATKAAKTTKAKAATAKKSEAQKSTKESKEETKD